MDETESKTYEDQLSSEFSEVRENARLKQILKKAVLKDKAPESLREAIRRMIRQ